MQSVFLILIRWIVIYPMDSAIQRLNNRGLMFLPCINKSNDDDDDEDQDDSLSGPYHTIIAARTCCVRYIN